MIRIFTGLFWIVILGQITACNERATAMVKGQPTPAFELSSLQGNPVDYPADFRDKVVVISFWADWCPICKKEMRDFEVLYQKYKKRGLSVVAINIAQDKATAEAFIEDLKLSYSIVLDVDGEVSQDYGIYSLPAVVVIDRDGNLDTRVLGETGIDVFDGIIVALL